ncbi:MAG: CBS domain-containing protein [Nitrospinales bacterium]
MSELPKEKIGDYMSSPVLSIDAEATVQEAARLMDARGVGSLLVKKVEAYVGIITERELTRKVVGEGLPSATLVSSVMDGSILSRDRNQHIMQANEYMKDHGLRHLAVTENGSIVGILSVKDFHAYYLNLLGLEE